MPRDLARCSSVLKQTLLCKLSATAQQESSAAGPRFKLGHARPGAHRPACGAAACAKGGAPGSRTAPPQRASCEEGARHRNPELRLNSISWADVWFVCPRSFSRTELRVVLNSADFLPENGFSSSQASRDRNGRCHAPCYGSMGAAIGRAAPVEVQRAYHACLKKSAPNPPYTLHLNSLSDPALALFQFDERPPI